MNVRNVINLYIISCILDICVSQRYPYSAQQYHPLISKADSENSKFAGAFNQESDLQTDNRGFHLKKFKLRRRLQSLINPCYSNGRETLQSRFLWDVNVYNIYPYPQGIFGCYNRPYMSNDVLGSSSISPLGSFLNLLLQNSQSMPQYEGNPTTSTAFNQFDYDDLQNVDATVDPNYRPFPPRQPPVRRRPTQVFYDSPGARPLTAAELVGGVATTVNSIIQQLTGNVQPVYPSYRRSARF